MILVIDVNLSPEWCEVLRGVGEVIHWSSIGNVDAPDLEIIDWAREQNAIILTNDLDFGAILAASGMDSPSVFQLRSQILDPLVIGDGVLRVIESFAGDLAEGASISFDRERSRVRRLPLR